jgi:hypothetical protein
MDGMIDSNPVHPVILSNFFVFLATLRLCVSFTLTCRA